MALPKRNTVRREGVKVRRLPPLAIGHFIGTSSVCVESEPQTPITAYTPDKATLSMHDGSPSRKRVNLAPQLCDY